MEFFADIDSLGSTVTATGKKRKVALIIHGTNASEVFADLENLQGGRIRVTYENVQAKLPTIPPIADGQITIADCDRSDRMDAQLESEQQALVADNELAAADTHLFAAIMERLEGAGKVPSPDEGIVTWPDLAQWAVDEDVDISDLAVQEDAGNDDGGWEWQPVDADAEPVEDADDHAPIEGEEADTADIEDGAFDLAVEEATVPAAEKPGATPAEMKDLASKALGGSTGMRIIGGVRYVSYVRDGALFIEIQGSGDTTLTRNDASNFFAGATEISGTDMDHAAVSEESTAAIYSATL